jgi:hypothetical protein
MLKSTIKAVQLSLVGVIIFLTGCNAPPAQPTLDPNMIYTAAAQTVQAQLVVASAGTATAAAVQPSATAAPTLLATVPAEPSPTFTQGATLSINLTPGVTAQPAATTAGIAIATLPPTAAPVAPVLTGEKGLYMQQDPDDGSLIARNTDFDMTWEIKNVGTTTWNTTEYYYANMVTNDKLAKKTWYFLKNEIKPNDTGKLVVDMKTPDASGKYKSSWCLLNKANPTRCIVIFDVTINVP